MSEHIWIPIGSSKPYAAYGTEIAFDDGGAYVGEFNGQGNLITGLQCRYATGVKKYGLFGTVTKSFEFDNIAFDEGGTVLPTTVHQTATGNGIVKNTFVDEYRYWTFQIGSDEAYAYKIGGIAGDVTGGGTVCASEARGLINIPECVPAQTFVGGLVGKVEGSSESVLIHSSMAMPEIKGVAKYVGGLVGYLSSTDSLLNSFSNSKFTGSPYNNSITVGGSTETVYFGGLVGVNDGLVENCYSRLQGNEPTNGTTSIFGWLAGTNNDSIKFSYAPLSNINSGGVYKKAGDKDPKGHGTYTATQRFSGKYGFKHRDHQMTPVAADDAIYITEKTNDTLIGGLMHSLNAWVIEHNPQENANNQGDDGGQGGGDPSGSKEGAELEEETPPIYATWTRTMASLINGDYPVPRLTAKNADENFNCVGSKDTIYLLYEDNIDHMYYASGKNFQALNQPGKYAAMYLYDVQPIVEGDKPADVTISGNVNVPLYIREDIGITQKDGAALAARVGVTIVEGANWHLFSSAISGVPMGIEYHGPVGYEGSVTHEVWGNRNLFDPPMTSWSTSNVFFNYSSSGSNNVGYFPTDTPYGTWRPNNGGHSAAQVGGFFDLYEYSEVYYHWINYKRQSDDHWHWDRSARDGKHYEINGYINDEVMPAGKAYLMALSSESMMMADGVLNNADSYSVTLTKTSLGTNLPPGGHGSYPYDEPWRGINLIGNPYQSYVNFNALSGSGKGEAPSVYAVIDESNPESSRRYVYYIKSQSRNDPYSATGLLHPHQGFFVKVDTETTVSFTKAMRVAGDESLEVPFRYEVNYPLVNLLCYDDEGNRDLTTIEVNRPEFGGGHKMEKLHESKGLIYAHLENESFQTLFTPEGINTVPVRFVPVEDGNFTLNWNTRHGNFIYLHLIDNLTGVDVDCLTADEYKFEAKTSDYKSRFKLVFRCDDDPDEPDEPDEPDDEEDTDHFAFMFGDELIVNGAGLLQMFDVQGRCLMETQAVGQQSSHSLPRVATGVYLLRLTGDRKVKVQKMVIK
jgi:hypothetical protein